MSQTTREDIPLKTGTDKRTSWFNICDECIGGSKLINLSFATLTIVITLALFVQIYYRDYQVVPHGSVASDSLECSTIGTSILKQGGNSIDAAIASAFCLGVVTPHITGFDAEGTILIYNHRTRTPPIVINFNNGVALPNLVHGLAYVHLNYGTLPWKLLIEPSVRIAKDGFLISKNLVQAITLARTEHIYGRLEPGRLLKLDTLSVTLKNIANIPDEQLTRFVESAPNHSVMSEATKTTFYKHDVYLPNSSATAGPILSNILEQISKHNFTASTNKVEFIQRITKIIQNFYLQNQISEKYHVGTSSNVAVMDLEENYVSLVTGMYAPFGSAELTSAGYLQDVKNRTIPCTRIPILVTDAYAICGRRISLGASDLALATQLLSSLLIAGQNVTEGIEAPRFHLNLDGTVGIEDSHAPFFANDIYKYLDSLTPKPFVVKEPYPSCNIVQKQKDDLSSHSDSRGGGIASRF